MKVLTFKSLSYPDLIVIQDAVNVIYIQKYRC